MKMTAMLLTCLLPALAASLAAQPPAPMFAMATPVQAPAQDVDAAERAAVLTRLAELELAITVDRDLESTQAALDELFGNTDTARALAADTDIAEARERLLRLLEEASGAGQSDLREALREALFVGDTQAIQDLGEPGFVECWKCQHELR